MTRPFFKRGDRVVCVRGTTVSMPPLVEGSTYTVASSGSSYNVELEGMHARDSRTGLARPRLYCFDADRFISVSPTSRTSPMNFKPGDIVVCVKPKCQPRLALGQRYVVRLANNDSVFPTVALDGVFSEIASTRLYRFAASRFKLAVSCAEDFED